MSHIEQAEFFNDYESLKNDPETFLYNYFAMIINEVDLRRETLKQDIDNYSDSIIEEIERTRADCYKIGEQIDQISSDLNISASEIETFNEKLNKIKHLLLNNKVYSFQSDTDFNKDNFGNFIQKNIGGKMSLLFSR